MPNLPFDHVTVQSGGQGRVKTLGSIGEAIEFLTHDWPVDKGRKFNTAMRVCVDALDGKQSGEAASLAFIEAADDAGIYIQERTPTPDIH